MSCEWNWPDWVPAQERELIERFWAWHGGADGWRRAFIEKRVYFSQPAEFGERVVGFWQPSSLGLVREHRVASGRWVPRWNSVGVMVIDSTDEVAFLPHIIRGSAGFDQFISAQRKQIEAARATQELAERFLAALLEAQKKALELLEAKGSTDAT